MRWSSRQRMPHHSRAFAARVGFNTNFGLSSHHFRLPESLCESCARPTHATREGVKFREARPKMAYRGLQEFNRCSQQECLDWSCGAPMHPDWPTGNSSREEGYENRTSRSAPDKYRRFPWNKRSETDSSGLRRRPSTRHYCPALIRLLEETGAPYNRPTQRRYTCESKRTQIHRCRSNTPDPCRCNL